MRIKILFFCYKIILFTIIYSNYAQEAIVIVPIADVLGASYCDQGNITDASSLYKELPYCGKSSKDCGRLHQLLFNERVTVLEQKGNELLVQIPSVFYELKGGRERYNSFWTVKKNIITVSELRNHGIDLKFFPEPIIPEASQKITQSIITLTMPFWDPKTKKTYSVGTRFVYDKKYNNDLFYKAFIYTTQSHTINQVLISKKIAAVSPLLFSYEKRRELFVSLLKKWAQTRGVIPYVWGGCSFTIPCVNNDFSLVNKIRNHKPWSYYDRPTNLNPKNGFDCTGLVVRAAQICGLPYYLKNSTTVEQNLRPLQKTESIVAGDIIWIPGHIMIVSDLKKNMLIEARAYNHGFGKVQELPLSKVFKNMETFDQLKEAYLTKKPLYRLNNKFEVVQTINDLKILKLSSIWS